MFCLVTVTLPPATFREFCLSLRHSSLTKSAAKPEILKVFERLRILKGVDTYPETRRGCRSGKSVKRARAVKRCLSVGLINARSVVNKENAVQQRLISDDLDILALTETWIASEHAEACHLS